MQPAQYMTDEAISRELDDLEAKFERSRADDDEGTAGSPGEWMVERMNELETEQKRRSGELPRYLDETYLKYTYFCDRDVNIRAHTEKMVKTRKPQVCSLCSEEKPAGRKMYCERAVVDGQWCSSYVCTPCMDPWVEENERSCGT